MISRRYFVMGTAAATAWPALGRAQQPGAMPRLGVLTSRAADDPEALAQNAALKDGLAAHGWVEGRTLHIDYRFGSAELDRIRAQAAELIALRPNVIVTSSTPPTAAVLRQTSVIPVVFVNVTDPIGSGFVTSLAKPGGNATGFTNIYEPSIAGKWIAALKEISPGTTRVALLLNPDTTPAVAEFLRAAEAAAGSFAMTAVPVTARSADELETAIAEFARQPNGGLMLMPDTFLFVHRDQIVSLAERNRLPAVYPARAFAAAGGLIAYGPNLIEAFRAAASYVDRILHGASLADLPVQNPTKLELVINIGVAKAIGISVPATLLARADEVIE